MRQPYDKLVRDHIPAIIESSGKACGLEVMSEAAYWQALAQKLIEEASEVAAAQPEELLTELADVQEVLDAILEAQGITRADLLAVQEQRRRERGGFGRRLRLLWTD